MTQPSESYPQLDSLIGGWFHQDFDIVGNAIEEIIAAYKQACSPEECHNTRADILRFLQERNDAQVKEDFVRLFYPGVDPEAWGMSTREWLLRIAELLQ